MTGQDSSSSDLGRTAGSEKSSREIESVEERASAGDIEKDVEIQRQCSRTSNAQAVPGLELDQDGGILGDEEVEEEERSGAGVAGEGGGLAGVVGRAMSRTTSKSSWNPGPPPDGGLRAWLTVLGGHLVIANTWGYINSYGVFQSYYATALSLPPSTISWIGSVQVFLLFFIGTFTGRLTDAGYFRQVFLLGCAFQVVGIFCTSACTEYWQLFLAQGVCMGLGNGCLFCPAIATVSTYFSRHRGIAIGVTACGGATGGLVIPSMVRQLLPTAGYAWTVRAIGFVQIFGLAVANLTLRTRVPPRRKGAIVEWAAFREAEYVFYAAGSFFAYMGVYFPFYYLASFSRDVVGMAYADSLDVLLVVNGAGILGRLALNHAGDRAGAITVFVFACVAAGACAIAWMAVGAPASLYAWTAFYGFFGGGIQSLFPAGLSSLTTDLRKAGVRMGMVFTINSFAVLAGPPVAGAIITAARGRYWGAQTFAGCVMLVGGVFMAAARVVRTRRIGRGWMVKI